MADFQLIIIGGGLSGLAAGIRAARFGRKTLILEQHALPGGLNSYYLRQGRLIETGLHAMTNFAAPGDKQAPLNLLFRQLRMSRRSFAVREQLGSEIRFPGRTLRFTNDPAVLAAEVAREFPASADRFVRLRRAIGACAPFRPGPWRSARQFVAGILGEPELEEMLLLPLMVYGNAEEEDMDLRQFVIMFRAVFEEGFFRPAGTIRDFLDQLVRQYRDFGGELRLRCPVAEIMVRDGRAVGVRLEDGTELTAEDVLSTAGIPETIRLSGWPEAPAEYSGRMSFMETVSVLPRPQVEATMGSRTIVFYATAPTFGYRRPVTLLDTSWGVICCPENFAGGVLAATAQLRVTNAASHPLWQALPQEAYLAAKARWTAAAVRASEEIIGQYQPSVVYQDSFTPVTIERFTRKAGGAVYGSPVKLRDGRTPVGHLFVAGTDQGYLGIVGAMLSGVTVVNSHLLQ